MSHSWWYLSRAAGIVAWALLTASVIWGLCLSTRVFDRKPSPKWFTDLHRFLGGTAVVFVGVHVGTIVADSYVHFAAADVLVPFASGWRPVAVAWGVVAMWLMLAVEVSSLGMRRLPRRVWHAIHLSSYFLFVSATVHALASGPDTRTCGIRARAERGARGGRTADVGARHDAQAQRRRATESVAHRGVAS